MRKAMRSAFDLKGSSRKGYKRNKDYLKKMRSSSPITYVILGVSLFFSIWLGVWIYNLRLDYDQALKQHGRLEADNEAVLMREQRLRKKIKDLNPEDPNHDRVDEILRSYDNMARSGEVIIASQYEESKPTVLND